MISSETAAQRDDNAPVGATPWGDASLLDKMMGQVLVRNLQHENSNLNRFRCSHVKLLERTADGPNWFKWGAGFK